jgi:hypothetical protein
MCRQGTQGLSSRVVFVSGDQLLAGTIDVALYNTKPEPLNKHNGKTNAHDKKMTAAT